MSETNIGNKTKLSVPQLEKAKLADAIRQRVAFLGMNQNAFTFNTELNLSDLPDLIDGGESDTTTEQLQAALEILYLSDDAWEINQIKMDGSIPPLTPLKTEEFPWLTIGEMIRRRRVELDLAQVEIARRVGVSGVLVSQWETGKSRIMADDIPKIAAALSTTSSRLMGELPTDANKAYGRLKRSLDDLSVQMSLDQLGDLCAAAAKILGRS